MPIDRDVAAGYGGVQSQQEAEADMGMLDRALAPFVRQVKAFAENFQALKAQRAFIGQHPDLAPEYDALLGRATFIQTQIGRAQKLIAAARSAWDYILGIFGLGELGVLPAVPIAIAAVAGAAALITKWLTDVFIFSRKVEAIKNIEAKGGITGREAAAMIGAAGPTGLMDVLQKNIIWIVLGGSLLLFGPELMKMLRRMK